MNYTSQGLDDILHKMVTVGNLLREAREELRDFIRVNAKAADFVIPEAVRTKLRRAMLTFDDVAQTFAANEPKLDSSHARLAMGVGAVERRDDGRLRVQRALFKYVDGKLVLGPDVIEMRADAKKFTGAILEVRGRQVVQNLGRGAAVIHDASRLNRALAQGEAVCIMYSGDRGHVVELASHDRAPASDTVNRNSGPR